MTEIMAMKEIVTLPQILKGEKEKSTEPLFIYRHTSEKQSLKNKILLQQNLISLLQDGEKVLHYANATKTIHNSQFAILSSGNCLMTEKLATDNTYQSILFFFDNVTLTNFFLKYIKLIEKIKSKSEKLKEPFIVFEKDDFIINYTSSLDFILKGGSVISKEMMQLKFEELMLYLLEKYPQTVLSLQASNQNEYSDFEIKKAVEQNITTKLAIEDLAFLCNTSISTFKRRFVKLYHTSPSQYFIQRKMEMAASLLLKNENPSEVFFKVGYENHSSFSQSFKQVFGISPKQYQQQNLTVFK